MVEGKVKVRFDPEADILYILLKEGPVRDTVEVAEDIFIEHSEDGGVAGIEVWRTKELVLRNVAEHVRLMIKMG